MSDLVELPFSLRDFQPFDALSHGVSVRVAMSTRLGGVSMPPFDGLNVGDHVGDAAADVAANRQRWAQSVNMRPVWMQQVHGVVVHRACARDLDAVSAPVADAAWSNELGVACAIMVADCLPVLFAHQRLPLVAAAHAGWRGLVGMQGRGVLESTVSALANAAGESREQTAEQLQVWLGPCIGPNAFEVGGEVRDAFVRACVADEAGFTSAARPSHFMADLAALARARLRRLGASQCAGNDSSSAWCTHTQAKYFFSHRRDASLLGSTGRMVAAISLG